MSESGQTAKYPLLADVLRFAREIRRQGMPDYLDDAGRAAALVWSI
jgi:hypothetical protein